MYSIIANVDIEKRKNYKFLELKSNTICENVLSAVMCITFYHTKNIKPLVFHAYGNKAKGLLYKKHRNFRPHF